MRFSVQCTSRRDRDEKTGELRRWQFTGIRTREEAEQLAKVQRKLGARAEVIEVAG